MSDEAELIGKVVYVDNWATQLGPAVQRAWAIVQAAVRAALPTETS